LIQIQIRHPGRVVAIQSETNANRASQEERLAEEQNERPKTRMTKRKRKKAKPAAKHALGSVELTENRVKALGTTSSTGSMQISGKPEGEKFIGADPPMRLDANMEEMHWLVDPDLDAFVAESKALGVPVEIGNVRTKPPLPGYGFAGPFSEIVITINPETLHLIVAYAVSLLAVHKTTNYFGIFFKKVVETLGEKAGSQIAMMLSSLWLKLNARIRTMMKEQQPPPMNLNLRFAVEGIPVYVNMEILPGRLNEISQEDQEQAAGLLFCKVIPELPDVIRQARASGENMKAVYATLTMPESTLDSYNPVDVAWRRGSWHWYVLISPQNRDFIIDRRGQRKDRPPIH
jgi:hypothetical protein